MPNDGVFENISTGFEALDFPNVEKEVGALVLKEEPKAGVASLDAAAADKKENEGVSILEAAPNIGPEDGLPGEVSSVFAEPGK